MPAATVITTTLATPPRRSRRVVDGRGFVRTCWARSEVRVAGAFETGVAFETAPRAVSMVERRRESRAKTYTSAAHDRVLPLHLMRT